MRKWPIATMVMLALVLAAAPAVWARGDKDWTPLEIKVGRPFQVIVPDQGGSTGYVTAVRTMPEGLVLLSTEVQRPHAQSRKKGGPMVGAPTMKVFTFVAERPLKGRLEINAARSWEKPVRWLYKPGDRSSGWPHFYYIRATR